MLRTMLLASVVTAALSAQTARQMPVFDVDAGFFKPLPNNWVTGQGSAVAVDTRDHVWVFHRPRYVPAGRTAAPPVLEYDADGRCLRGWGGFADGYEWFDQEHGIYVDDGGYVWLTGSARPALAGPGDRVLRSDNMLLKFTSDGRFVLQIGKRDQSTGNDDTRNVYSATDLSVHPKTNEVFVADGYINRRVIVFDAGTGAFKRMWGAFGNPPVDPPNMLENARTPARPRGTGAAPAAAAAATGRGQGAAAAGPDLSGNGPSQFAGPVHSAKVSNDGLVYVADRGGHRLQVFTADGRYVTQVRIDSPSGVAISSDPSVPLHRAVRPVARGRAGSADAERALPVRHAQRRAGALPRPARARRRFEGQPVRRRGRARQPRAEVRLQGADVHAAAERAHALGALGGVDVVPARSSSPR
jgi:hypothetical protein